MKGPRVFPGITKRKTSIYTLLHHLFWHQNLRMSTSCTCSAHSSFWEMNHDRKTFWFWINRLLLFFGVTKRNTGTYLCHHLFWHQNLRMSASCSCAAYASFWEFWTTIGKPFGLWVKGPLLFSGVAKSNIYTYLCYHLFWHQNRSCSCIAHTSR